MSMEKEYVKMMRVCLEFAMHWLPLVAIATLPLLIVFAKSWCLCHGGLFLMWAGEVWFFVFQMSNSRRLQKRRVGYWKADKRAAAIEKLLEHMGDPADSAEQLLQRWHLEKTTSPCMAHFVKTLVWLFFDRAANELNQLETIEAQRMLLRFREKLAIPNTNNTIAASPKCIRPSLDQVKMFPKPFLFYLLVLISRLVAAVYFSFKGFSISATPAKKHIYWVKTGQSPECPIVFSTGFGLGSGGYILFIHHLLRHFPNRTIVIFETPYGNFRPAAPIATEKEALREIDDMFQTLQLASCTWVGHSFGTNVASWVVKHRPHYITKLILVDPTCFRTWDTSLYTSLFYRPCDSTEPLALRLFMAQEPNIACAITRQLNWYENTLFPEKLAIPTEIFLAAFDTVINKSGCQTYLEHRIAKDNLSHIHLNTIPTSHGSFQFSLESIAKVISAL